ncbi:histone-lysine N-methyltransferase ASHH3 [Amborella trichopoda]|nr:histone-lysine N-methyltransferase ASHH3 [Amborella trichopoda]|eukprot:XP_006842860.2 histone-lysine N-methyltransferase ASHH3 [Amborella trichopoda]
MTYMKKKMAATKKLKGIRVLRTQSAQKDVRNEDQESDMENMLDDVFHVPESSDEFEISDLLKKRKPPYTFIKRNVYLMKRMKRRSEDDGIFCSCRPSPGSLGVCGINCHCGMLLSTCSSNCNCGSACINKPFQHRNVKKMKLVKTEKCGFGLVADEDFKKGEFVIEYVGEVIDDKTCEDRLWKMKHRGDTSFYLCEISRDMVIDATYKGNKSRYINHSCEPNTEMQKWRSDGETRIGIFATRNIRKGDAVTYDYQFVQFGKDQECHCGTSGCRGKLGVKPNKQKLSSDVAMKLVARELAVSSATLRACRPSEKTIGSPCGGSVRFRDRVQDPSYCGKNDIPNCIGQRVKVWWPLDRRYYHGKLTYFDPNSRKHTILYDDGDIERIDMSKERWDFLTWS